MGLEKKKLLKLYKMNVAPPPITFWLPCSEGQRDLNPGSLAPQARIIPLDQRDLE